MAAQGPPGWVALKVRQGSRPGQPAAPPPSEARRSACGGPPAKQTFVETQPAATPATGAATACAAGQGGGRGEDGGPPRVSTAECRGSLALRYKSLQ
jgi:hypothetical protein